MTDFRRILDDKAVDALVVATCNHWHAPAAILACAAGKHVYVEKPCSHNPREGELLVAGRPQAQARRPDRHPAAQLADDHRGDRAGPRRARSAGSTSPQSWYTNNRPSIGHGKAGRSAGGARLRPLAGPGPAPAVHATTSCTTTGTGSGTGATASWATTASTRSTSAAGAWASTTRSASPRRAAATASTTTRRRPTRTSSRFEFAGDKLITWEGLSCNAAPRRPGVRHRLLRRQGHAGHRRTAATRSTT